MSEQNSIPTSPSLNTQLANAVADVAKTQDRLNTIRARLAYARQEERSALDEVNKAQKHFDALVAEVKKQAIRDTDHWRELHTTRGVAVEG